jgi:hypothetical protein
MLTPQAISHRLAARDSFAQFITSIDERAFSNLKIAAPETDAWSPAPATTITRTAGFYAKRPRITGMAAHMSGDTARRRAGFAYVIQPVAPSIPASMVPVASGIFTA